MQNPPRKHHYIPCFYSQGWAGADGRVERFTMPHGSRVVVRRVFPSQVGFQTDLYSSPEPEASNRQWLEQKFFAKLDNIAADALARIRLPGDTHLTDEEASAWSVFILSLLHRSPAYLAATKAKSQEILRQSIAAITPERYALLKRDTDPPTVAEYIAQQTADDEARAFTRILPGLLSHPGRLQDFLHSLDWRVADFGEGEHELLLSDDPLVRTNGLATDDGHLALPLSPRRLLLATHRPQKLAEIMALPPRDLIRQINTMTVESAREFVVASDRSQERFIANRFGCNPRPPLMSGPRRAGEPG